ncbi:thioredoxin [Neobacillus sp. MM2021_6]|uniref:thioredoxin n=1 Tax=Bacillaceae TaxID=186817 RepID=UPI00140A4F18|nr:MULTISPECIES: thioredoxin [Bacillaceae]MBO0962153.1 thioredoxin [Neobacillus sp. MM2021_6]NHC21074.1 thioredoxin [Bacillus sp. MM2020_4]
MAILNVTDQTFTAETTNGIVLADFFATWCGPCKIIAPVLEELDQDMGNRVKIVKIDVDQNQETTNKFGIMSIPTLLVMKDGKLVDTLVGLQSKETLEEALNRHI